MTLSIRHLTPADYRVMPWKNGQGTTTEIAAMPQGAGLDAFAWRISVADVGASGPFSCFPGVERVIVQTEGEPMALVHEGRGRRNLALLRPHRFSGDEATSGEVSGPVRDFNVMARRGRMRASVAVHELASGSRIRVLAAREVHIVYAFRGGLSVAAGATGEVWSLSAGDTWQMTGDADDDTSFEISAGPSAAVAFVVDLG